MRALAIIKLLSVLLLAESISARTITHQQTITKPNGDKVVNSWTTHEEDNDSNSEAFFPAATATLFNVQPQSETVRIGGSSEQLLKQLAADKGMDAAAVSELLAKKQPVIQRDTDEQGRARTITYQLEPNGDISRKTVTEVKPIVVQPPSLRMADPWSTVSAEHKKKIDSDWEWNPQRSAFDTSPFTRTFTRKWQSESPTIFTTSGSPANWPKFDDDFNRRLRPGQEATTVKLPESWDPSTWPNYKQPVHSDLPRPTAVTPLNTNVKSAFDDMEPETPRTVTNTNVDEHGNKVTTTYTVGPTKWTRKTYTYPASVWPEMQLPATVPSLLPSSTTPATTIARTTPKTTQQLSTTPLPSLQDFLRSQYGSSTRSNKVQRDYTTTPSPPRYEPPTATTNKPVTNIKVEDLPITQILHNGTPVDEHFVQTLPKEFRPVLEPTTSVKTIKIENIPMSELPLESEPQLETSVRSYSATVHSPHLPTAADLDPKLQDILKRAGINPDDITSADGNTISKTRTEPDGRTITTTYRVQSSPTLILGGFDDVAAKPAFELSSPSDSGKPLTPFTRWLSEPSSSFDFDAKPLKPTLAQPSYNQPPHILPDLSFHFPERNDKPFAPRAFGPIAQFLSKIGLSIADVESSNREYVKTIVDDDGSTLTAIFRLTSGNGTQPPSNIPQLTKYNPIK